MRDTIIFDIDGVIANCDHRLPLIKKEQKDWKAFHALTYRDEPILDMIKLNRIFYTNQKTVLLCTARPEDNRALTTTWLHSHDVYWHRMYMRKKDDYRPDSVVKLELLADMRKDGYEPSMVFEDRTQVVTMWREQGIRCLQVCAGDY